MHSHCDEKIPLGIRPDLGKFLSAGALGILLGIIRDLRRDPAAETAFSAIEAGPWTGWPRSEASEIDPYTRAILAYSGKIALSEFGSYELRRP